MPKYKCENEECKMYDKEFIVQGGRITFVEGKAITTGQACPSCNKPRTVVRESGMTSAISGTNDQKIRMYGHA